MLWRRLLKTLQDGPAGEIHLGAGTALSLLVRFSSYALVAVGGIVMARALGAHDRGVYSLVFTIAVMYAAISELGISFAGIYFVGQGKHSLQAVTSNSLAWWLAIGAVWMGACLALGLTQPAFVPDELGLSELVLIGLGGVLLQLSAITQNVLMATGSVIAYNVIDFTEPALRGVLVIGGILLLGFGLLGVLSSWLLAIAVTTVLSVYLLAKRVRPTLSLRPGLLREQLAYGLKGNLGFILQAANHRLDVVLVAGFAGATALGQYAVAFGMAELLWQVPLALGAVFFPKVAALDPEANAEIAATTCRRGLFAVFCGVLVLVATGRLLIGTLYGGEFLPGTTAFYILAPSALLYTIHRVLSSALAGRGMPEASLYGGLVSFPVTIGLGLALIPALGIEGAAIASTAAYATNAIAVLIIFLRVTRRSMSDVLLINRSDLEFSLQTARGFLARTAPLGAD
jgi:O-antigen/teichoic acid export membrane protein